jgi:hypothetical protein
MGDPRKAWNVTRAIFRLSGSFEKDGGLKLPLPCGVDGRAPGAPRLKPKRPTPTRVEKSRWGVLPHKRSESAPEYTLSPEK